MNNRNFLSYFIKKLQQESITLYNLKDRTYMATKKDKSAFASILETVKATKQLTLQAVIEYSIAVENIIESKTKNQKTIERCLDGMLDFCHNEKMLLQYKKLCRYYLPINESVVVEYVNIYRELWDSEDNQIDKKKKG